MRNQELKKQRDDLIYQRYCQLWGEQQLREEVIWPILTTEFHLTPRTIYRIILSQTKMPAASNDPVTI
jgi:hypothetical protein